MTKLVVTLCIPGLPFNGETFHKQSLGGSESAGYYLARALAKLGHNVTVFCNTEKMVSCADVDYIPLQNFRAWIEYTPHDVCIVQRAPDMLQGYNQAKLTILWCHDLAMKRGEGLYRGVSWNYDKVAVLSEFMRGQYKQVYGFSDSQLFLTRNGVDLEAVAAARAEFESLKTTARNPLSMFFAARPERGLDILLAEVMPRILKQEPNAKLFLSAYHNPVDQLADFYDHCRGLAAGMPNNVIQLGSLTKAQLYAAYHAAGQYVYPTPSRLAPDFDEISPVHGDTLIETVSGPKKIKDLKGMSGFYVYSRRADGSLGASKVNGVWRTRRDAEVLTLRLRPGRGVNAKRESTLTLTPDHEVMLRDGTYRKAGELRVGDRVMAVTTNYEKRDGVPGYQTLRITGEKPRYGHQIVAESVLQRALDDGEVIHHLDGDRANNEPVNIEVTTQSEHRARHWAETPETEKERQNARRSETGKKIWGTPAGRESRRRSALARWHGVGENHVVFGIEMADTADVFCMEVEPDHNFIANGIVVHNCISVMEAQACGMPVVTSARGALPETLSPEAGRLIAEPVLTAAYADAFAEACLRYMRDPEARRRATAAGLARAATLGWDGVAKQWSEMMEAEIRSRSADLATLANHFWRRSDIYAAKECLKRLPADDAASAPVRRRIEEDWAFLDQTDGMRTQYERIGATHDPRVIDWSPQEPRYRAIRQWLQARVAELPEEQMLSVLDYGCAHGGYATNLLKEIPQLRITGIDIDLRGIQLADQFAEKLGVSDRWRGVVGDLDRLSDPDVPEMLEKYDIVMAQEVLEHVPDPAALVVALDARVKDGGRVWMTVPHGPWEYSDYRRYPHRAHVREFDLHDLHELLDAKGRSSQLSISSMPFGHSPETDEALGWWVVQYEVHPDGRGKIGAIDMDRKLAIQRPRQTVSATIMAGGDSADETLHWCLKSLVHVADELIIADCGLSEEAHRIIDQYRWVPLDGKPHAYLLDIRIIPGGDPKTDGFETPRNRALSEARGDWVLWLDTDEKLLQPDKVAKYLRPNGFDGYSIKQHHFSVDANFGADLPVRLFRNPMKTGSGMRFIGMIHEHPEKGLNMGPGMVTVLPDVHIPHVGYLIESGRQKKFGRNLPMLEADMAKYPERLLQKHFIMRDKMLLVGHELRNNGSRVTPGIRKACDEVVELYRKHFLGKGHFTNVDPIEYYSQANAVLAQGFDSAFSINVDKVDAHLNGTTKARFATVEDFVAEITNRARDAAAPMDTRYW